MNKENLCLKCPVQGRCCYHSIMIEGYNIILDHQPCELLDIETKLCKNFEKRKEIFDYCKDTFESNTGAFPKECLYLKAGKIHEKYPKLNIKDIANKLTPMGLMIYNLLNNIEDKKKLYEER